MTLVLNGSTGVSAVDGSASTPAVQGTDTNTGVFFPAADIVAISTGGTERLRVTTTGDIRIQDDKRFCFGSSGNGNGWSGSTASNLLYAITNNVERMRIDSSGNVGIGTSSPGVKLDVSVPNGTQGINCAGIGIGNGTAFAVGESELYTSSADLGIGTGGSNNIRFWTASAERARITSGGDFYVGTTANAGVGGFTVVPNTSIGSAQINFNRNTSASGSTAVVFRDAGNIVGSITYTNSSAAYNTSSDYRLKENVKPMQNALAKVALLNPVTYNWKVDGSDGQGFIAHELQAVCPDAVTGEKDAVDAGGNPIYQGVDTSFLVATLTKAIQELNAKVDALQTELNALKGAA